MDAILGIDNNETKTVGISNEAGGITGSIDFYQIIIQINHIIHL